MTKKMSRLQQLNRVSGNIEPELKYSKSDDKNLKQVEENLKQVEKRREEEKKKNNQKYSLKYGDDVKKKMEAQKQIEGMKYDYEFLNALLDRNVENYTQKDKMKYNILIE